VKANYTATDQEYPYSWLDDIIGITLNPEKTKVTELKEQQLDMIESKFDLELRQVLSDLKQNTFFLFSDKKIKTTVSHYYESLLLLEEQAKLNLAGYPSEHPLAETGENLLLHIQYVAKIFRKRYEKYLPDIKTLSRNPTNTQKPVAKVLFKFSVDQLGILIKAADDSKMLIASSLSIIFRLIVPYLSTDKIKTISWNSMRKSTYQMEQHDKDFVIAALEKLILKIKEY